jgi:hypothetical protein
MSSQSTLASRARVKEGVLFQELSGEAILLDSKAGIYFGLNDVGTRTWKLLEAGETLAQIIPVIVSEFDTTTEVATTDLVALVEQLEDRQLIRME